MITLGNLKIGSDTLIFNICPAHDCPSKKLGLCQLPNPFYCYAFRDERRYPGTLQYRKRQAKYWDRVSVDEFVADVLSITRRRPHIKYLRVDEAGDFRNIDDIRKVSEISERLKAYGIRVYGYTARKDLMGGIETSDNLVINGSGFIWDNAFMAVGELPKRGLKCAGNCRFCSLCKVAHGKPIYEKIRTI